MKQPRFPVGHSDRSIELAEHLEPSFLALVEIALAVGYSEQEALAAIASLVDNRQLAIAANGEVDDLLRRTFRSTDSRK